MLLPILLALQTSVAQGQSPRNDLSVGAAEGRSTVPLPTASAATAARATVAPTLDGVDDDELWQNAPAITQFRQHEPVEDGDPRYRTEAKVGYDAKYLYVFVRAFDPHPDSVMAFLSRRDGRTQSDYIHLMVDGYRDRRTGFRFTTNPLGVKRDVYISNDGNEDMSWDGVWDVVSKVDSLGWTAEYRVPFSQLRYPQAAEHTFGFAIWRDVARHNERISWPVYRRSRQGFVSQFGEVSGFVGITAPRRLEFVPYTVATNLPKPVPGASVRHQEFAFGADVKYGVTSNLTLDGTVNPDFGQVEADPASLNLSAFELFFQERRPFFLEGAGTFNFAGGGNGNGSPSVFYSRRIGRGPQLSGNYYSDDNVNNSTILGAAKVTGRTSGGLNVGFLNAYTQRETGAGGATIEPATNYLVTRLAQDLRNGNSGLGMIVTATNRMLDDDSRDYLRESAYAVGVDGRHRFGGNNYQVSGSAIYSTVSGSAEAITATQRSSAHYYQRVGSSLDVDPNATSLSGTRLNLGVGKNGGGITRFNTGVTTTSAGYEVNDAGFMNRADVTSNGNYFGLNLTKPTKYYRMMYVNFNQSNDFNTDGMHISSYAGANINGQLNNQWWFWTGFNLNNIFGPLDDRLSRGGPAVRKNFRPNIYGGFETDGRRSVELALDSWYGFRDASGSRDYGMSPTVSFRIASALQGSVGLYYNDAINDQQWYGNFTDGSGTHYAFAPLHQKTSSITTRLDYTMTPTLSLQVYAQPFVASGDYGAGKELVDPTAGDYDDRYAPYAGAQPGDFNVKSFTSNTVLRWEYRPGSVLFFVWQQGRSQDGLDAGSFRFGRDFGNLFDTRSDNTFLVKGSYWFSR